MSIDQCTSTEQVARAHKKLQEQLDRTKDELDSWQNETLQFVQCPGQCDSAHFSIHHVAKYADIRTYAQKDTCVHMHVHSGLSMNRRRQYLHAFTYLHV